jgi:acetoin utilization protein AcuB
MWMTRELYTVEPDDSIAHARELMARYRINQLPVVADSKLLGIVTDRDLRTVHDVKPSARPHSTVGAIMTHPVIALSSHSTLVNAAKVMRQQRIGSVLIVDGDSLQGILTRSDILDAFVAYAIGRHKRAQPITVT